MLFLVYWKDYCIFLWSYCSFSYFLYLNLALIHFTSSGLQERQKPYALFFGAAVLICKHFRLQSKCRPAIMLISSLVTQLSIWVLLRLNLMSATQQFEVWNLDGFDKQHCQHPHDASGHFGADFTWEGKKDHSGFTWWLRVFCLSMSVAQDSYLVCL